MPWMRMFIGREAVLRKLNHMYESEKFQMLVLWPEENRENDSSERGLQG